jgi:drug/metabolite transporter (DMT)-like permease
MPATPVRQHRPLAGILFCVFALLGFAIQDSIIKGLSLRYPLLQVLCIRSAMVLALLVIVGLYVRGPGVFRGNQPKPLMLRGVLAFFAFTTYYLALSRVPLADAAAVYMTAPLFVTLLSAVLLGEKVGIHRWGAVIAGFTAVVIMLAPGSSLFRFEAAIPLFSALCYAMIPIINRYIGMTEHALTMAIYTTVTYLTLIVLTSAIIHLVPAPESINEVLAGLFQRWHKMAPGDLGLSFVASCLFSFALLGITQAYRIAIVSTVTPFEYSYLVWATLIGFLIFGDVPSSRTIFGGLAVVVCGCYIILREKKLAGS